MRPPPHVPPFVYQPSDWSVGDRLLLALSFAEEPALRAALAVLGLSELGDFKIHSVWWTETSPPLRASLFGPALLLEIGPEDRYDHLDELHVEQAREIAALVERNGLTPFVVAPFDPELTTTPPPVPSQAHRLLARRQDRLLDLASASDRVVQIGDGDAVRGFATTMLFGPRERRGFRMEAPRVTAETQVRGVAEAVRRGAIGVATVAVGQVSPGSFGPIAQALTIATTQEIDVDVARRVRAEAAALGVSLEGDDESRAALHRLVAEGTLENELVAELLVGRDAISSATLRSAFAIVAAALRVMQRRWLPCLFDARRALDAPPDLDTLFQQIVEELNRSLAATGTAERFQALYFGEESLPTHARLTPAEHARLAARGLVHERSALDVRLDELTRAASAQLDALDPSSAAILRSVDARSPGERLLALARLPATTPTDLRIRDESTTDYDAIDRSLSAVRDAAIGALSSDAGRRALAAADDDVLFALGRGPGTLDLVRSRLAAKPPLAERVHAGHRAVILPSPSPRELASGGVMVDGVAFLDVPVVPTFLSVFAEWVVVGVQFHPTTTWHIVLDIARRRCSIREPRLLGSGITLHAVSPAGVTFAVDGRTEHFNFHELAWIPLAQDWRWPAIPDAARSR